MDQVFSGKFAIYIILKSVLSFHPKIHIDKIFLGQIVTISFIIFKS